jgi:hypothetical protein
MIQYDETTKERVISDMFGHRLEQLMPRTCANRRQEGLTQLMVG